MQILMMTGTDTTTLLIGLHQTQVNGWTPMGMESEIMQTSMMMATGTMTTQSMSVEVIRWMVCLSQPIPTVTEPVMKQTTMTTKMEYQIRRIGHLWTKANGQILMEIRLATIPMQMMTMTVFQIQLKKLVFQIQWTPIQYQPIPTAMEIATQQMMTMMQMVVLTPSKDCVVQIRQMEIHYQVIPMEMAIVIVLMLMTIMME